MDSLGKEVLALSFLPATLARLFVHLSPVRFLLMLNVYPKNEEKDPMQTIEANVFANAKCPSCRGEWNNETGEAFEASLAKLLRKRSGVHHVPAILCAECQDDETWRTIQRCAADLRSLAQELANASVRRDTERSSVMIDDMIGLLAEAQGVFPARYARSLARPAVID